MKWSFFSAGMIMFGIVGFGIIFLFVQLTVNSDEEYYLLKEVTEAAMYDSIDLAYYRSNGELKIIKEKFVENFIRRFAESTNINAEGYKINIYNVIESPPKVSVEITSELGERYFFNSESDDIDDNYSVINDLDAIFEFNYY